MSLKVWGAPPYTMCVSKLVTLIDTHHVLWICAMILAWAVNWRKEHTHMPHVCTLAACIDGKSVEFQFSGDRSFVVCVDLPFQCAWGIRCNNNVNGKHLCSAVCGSAQVWHPFIVRYWLQVLRSSSNVQLAVLRYPCRQCTNMQANFFCSCVFFLSTRRFSLLLKHSVHPHVHGERHSSSTRYVWYEVWYESKSTIPNVLIMITVISMENWDGDLR